ncbi:MAG TPA: peptidase S16 [Chitinophagaceae bacterium]|nr:peptidase S16 [Chitinophagaceae bacterium]
MTNFIPIFPLGIVVFPGEQVNLHIFEPRYKQLINDCYAAKKPFGIPLVINNAVAEMGTLVQVSEIVAIHPDGKMDIRTRGEKVFRILELVKSIPDKLYSGSIVHYPDNDERQQPLLLQKVVTGIRELHQIIGVSKDFKKPDHSLCSYDLAHHAGLSVEEEYEFLGLMHELQRLEYLKRHLAKILPVVSGIESLKEKIQNTNALELLKGFNFNV